jgi:hypothetical protein
MTETARRCEGKYRPGLALVGEATPQSHPDLFTDDEIRAEIRYLLRLNKRYGTHILRTQAYLKLGVILKQRHCDHPEFRADAEGVQRCGECQKEW